MAGRIKEDQAQEQRLGVNSTPTFMIGELAPDGRITLRKKMRGAASYSVLKMAIEDLIKSLNVADNHATPRASPLAMVFSNDLAVVGNR